MRLPIFKSLTHISPSTFNTWRTCQYKIYLGRLAGLPYVKHKQGMAAAVGNAFDSCIKDYIAQRMGDTNPVLGKAYLFNKTIHDEHRQQAIPIGEELFKLYVDSGYAESIFHTDQIVLDREMYTHYKGIPILGIVDMIWHGFPFDWKTRGMVSKSGAYATKGWRRRWKITKRKSGTMHIAKKEESPNAVPIEECNESWAIQLLFYNWMIGNEEKYFYVHELCKHKDDYWFATHEGEISKTFEDRIFTELQTIWEAITGDDYHAEVKEPEPHIRVCNKYNVLCDVADACKFYENTLGNPMRRAGYGG